MVPAKQEASVFFHIHRNSDNPLDGGNHSYVQKDEYEAFKNTQANMVRHKANLEAALAKDRPGYGIGVKPITRGPQASVFGYLARRNSLEIDFPPETEFMIVKLKGEDAKQLFKLVDSICNIYYTESTTNLK